MRSSVPKLDIVRPLFSTLIEGDRGVLKPALEDPLYKLLPKLPDRLCRSTEERARLKGRLPPPVSLFKKLEAERLDEGVVLAPS